MSNGEFELVPQKPRRPLGVGCLTIALFFVFIFLLGPIFFGSGYIEAGLILIFGWVAFFQRTIPGIVFNWDLIGMGVICLGGILCIAHLFLRWLVGTVAARRGTNSHWPWRWTWCGVGALGVLFLVGMAVGGATHQIGLISSSPEPLMELKRPLPAKYEMRTIELGIKVASVEETNRAAIRSLVWDAREKVMGSGRDTARLLQSYHVLLIAPSNHFEGYVIFPRDAAMLQRMGGIVSQGDEQEHVSAAELREKLRVLGDALKPL